MSTAAPRARGGPGDPEIIGLSLLDGYKVRWSRETVARDIVQNFFDEVEDFREVSIDVDAARGTVEVRGPSGFDLEYLRYIGATTKVTRRAAGGFGEGFKVCALVLVRDFGCTITAGSRRWEIRPFLQPMKLGRELCYEVRTLSAEEAHAGSFVRIAGADARLCAVFAGAKELFRHPDNPRLARPIHVDEAEGIGVFEARDGEVGELYYRRQLRGTMRFALGGALTFAFDGRLDALEGDRDRRDLALTFPLVTAVAARLSDEALAQLIRRLRAYWQHGGKVLGALLAEGKRRGLRLTFPRRWLARIDRGYHLERHAERLGFHLGVQRLAGVGMPTLEDRFAVAQVPRAPTAVEAARVKVARDLYALLLGQPPIFARFRVVEVDERGSDFRKGACVIPAESLAAAFGEGIAPTLARLACTSGLRSRRNADRLTGLLEGAMRRAGTLDGFQERWAAAAADPSREGADPEEATDDDLAPGILTPKVSVAILAPQGFPPCAALEARIKKLCAAMGVQAQLVEAAVDGPRQAHQEYARGIPSVWIGATEIEPPRGQRPAFEVRTFAASGGGRAIAMGGDPPCPPPRAIVPGDEALAAAIAVEAGLVLRGRGAASVVRERRRRALGSAALERWLYIHAPAEYLELVETQALNHAQNEVFGRLSGLPHPVHALARALAKRRLPALLDAEDEAGREGDVYACASIVVAGGYDRVGKLLGALEQRAPGLLEAAPVPELALASLLGRAEKLLADGTGEDDALATIAGQATAVLEVCRGLETAPLDAGCARACVNEALAHLWETPAAGSSAAALHAARQRFDAAVEIAAQRHGEEDAEGNPLSCWGFGEALAAVYGRPPVFRLKTGSPEIAAAVRSAWEGAITEGADEIEATRRCLSAAAAASAMTMKEG